MKKLLALTLLSSSLLLANVTVEPAQKIAFADAYSIIQNLDEWKEESERVQQEIGQRAAQIEKLKAEAQRKAQELQVMGSTAKPSVIEARREEILDLQNKIQIKQQGTEEFAQRISQEAQMTILKNIEIATKEIAQERGFDIVIGGGALYVNKQYDISDEVAARMNKKHAEKKKKETPVVKK